VKHIVNLMRLGQGREPLNHLRVFDRRFLADDLVAKIHTLRADVNARPGDKMCDLLAPLAAKRAAQIFPIIKHWHGGRGLGFWKFWILERHTPPNSKNPKSQKSTISSL